MNWALPEAFIKLLLVDCCEVILIVDIFPVFNIVLFEIIFLFQCFMFNCLYYVMLIINHCIVLIIANI